MPVRSQFVVDGASHEVYRRVLLLSGSVSNVREGAVTRGRGIGPISSGSTRSGFVGSKGPKSCPCRLYLCVVVFGIAYPRYGLQCSDYCQRKCKNARAPGAHFVLQLVLLVLAFKAYDDQVSCHSDHSNRLFVRLYYFFRLLVCHLFTVHVVTTLFFFFVRVFVSYISGSGCRMQRCLLCWLPLLAG